MLKEIKNAAATPLYREKYHRTYEMTGCSENILHISILKGRDYQDGTSQYMIYLDVPFAESHETITLNKLRGTMEDAEKRANEILFGKKE